MKLAMQADGILSPPLSEIFEKACVECFPEDMLDPSVVHSFGILLINEDVLVMPEDHGMSIHCFVVNELNLHSIWTNEDQVDEKMAFDTGCRPALDRLSAEFFEFINPDEDIFNFDQESVEVADDQIEYLDMLCTNLSEIEKAYAKRFLRENGYIDVHAINSRRDALRAPGKVVFIQPSNTQNRSSNNTIINFGDKQA